MKSRILLAGLATVVAMAFGASSASAVTVGPVGQHTATAGTTVFKVDNFSFVCAKSTLPTAETPDGLLHITGYGFSNCEWTFGPITVSETELPRPVMAFDQNGLNTTLSNIKLAFKSNFCNFNVTGSESTTNLGPSPLTLSELVFPNTAKAPATLKLSSFPAGETSHCLGEMTLNSPVEFSSTYKFSSPLTVTK